MKKRIAPLLLLMISALTFTAISSCADKALGIEDNEWQMGTAIRSDGESFAVVALAVADEAYPDAKTVELTLTAKSGTLTVTDVTNNKRYTGSYTVIGATADGTNYEITLEGKTGYATASTTKYSDDTQEATLPITLGEYSLYFYANNAQT